MIDTTILQTKLHTYFDNCQNLSIKPTFEGVGRLLGTSGKTISNVVHGHYNGRRYTDKPHITRCISNDDFEIVKGLFELTPER